MDSTEGLSPRSAVVGLRSGVGRTEDHRRHLAGAQKPLQNDKKSSSAFAFSAGAPRRSSTVASFSECREHILVAVPPSGSTTDAALRPLRERYAIAILQYQPGLPSASFPRAGTSPSVTTNGSLHKNATTMHNSSGISTGSTSGSNSSSSNNRSPSDIQYDVEVPWCCLPYPRGSFLCSEGPASTASPPTIRTPTMVDSRSSYPTPVLIRWWDYLAPSSKEDAVEEEKKALIPSAKNDPSNSGPVSCPRILVVWSSGEVQLLQPWKTPLLRVRAVVRPNAC